MKARLQKLSNAVGKNRLVLDLKLPQTRTAIICRHGSLAEIHRDENRAGKHWRATGEMVRSEFLVHAADVRADCLAAGSISSWRASWASGRQFPATYAGGANSLRDPRRNQRELGGRQNSPEMARRSIYSAAMACVTGCCRIQTDLINNEL